MVEDRSDMLFARSVILVEGQSELFALPSFARKLGYTLDKSGISIVCTNGKGNFKVYHQILDAFNVPHMIFGDGDGKVQKHQDRYERFMDDPDSIHLLDEDFEHLIVTVLSDNRVLEIVNICRVRRGKTPALTMNDLQDAFRLEAVNLKSAWWKDLKDDINRDIAQQHRDNYQHRKENLQNLLLQLAQEVTENDHLVQTALEKRKAKKLKKQGKPLLGRVLGDELTIEEIEQMNIRPVFDKACELAQNQ
jgi:predicted ATP-dependent endonuclease of OLD family